MQGQGGFLKAQGRSPHRLQVRDGLGPVHDEGDRIRSGLRLASRRRQRQQQPQEKAKPLPVRVRWRQRWFAVIHFVKDVPC